MGQGALGIPSIGIFPAHHHEYSFVNTKVSNNVEYAFQALALDEHRKAFSPTVWERPEGEAKLKLLKQVWFPGVHSNVGFLSLLFLPESPQSSSTYRPTKKKKSPENPIN